MNKPSSIYLCLKQPVLQMALLFMVCFSTTSLVAATIKPGDVIIGQSDNVGTVVVIDPVTRDRTIVSQWDSLGSGPEILRIGGILFQEPGSILATEHFIHQGLYNVPVRRTAFLTGMLSWDCFDFQSREKYHAQKNYGQRAAAGWGEGTFVAAEVQGIQQGWGIDSRVLSKS